MAQRIYRLSISPEDVPEVRRVFDFDGRCSLDDLHEQLARQYRLDRSDRLYAFFMSGRYWDEATAYFDPRTDGRRADRALLFRLNLQPGKAFAYLLDFKDEQRFTVTVVAVNEVEHALASPQLIESVGEAAAVAPEPASATLDADPPELGDLVPLAEAFLDIDDELAELDDASVLRAPRDGGPILQAAGQAALSLLTALGSSTDRFFELDQWLLERSLSVRLLDTPLRLSTAGQGELAIALARALIFVDRELMEGDLAIALAEAGQREEALTQLASNLAQARDAALVEGKAGDVHRALGDLPAAEAYYRRSLVEANTASDRMAALLRVVACLVDQGRENEASTLLSDARKLAADAEAKANPKAVARNEACPCGSGKKYKKCHGG